MNRNVLSFLVAATIAFAGTREENLKIILEKTYLSTQAEPILNMVATQAIEEVAVNIQASELIEKFREKFHDEKLFAELCKPYESTFSDPEIEELRKIHENPVWQKYAIQGTSIFTTHLSSIRNTFHDLTGSFAHASLPLADIWQISDSNFEDLLKSSDKPVIVEVGASWCSACRMMAPVFDEVSGEYDDVQFAKMDIDSNQHLARKLGVKGLPTILFFKAGQIKPTVKYTGAMNKEDFEKKIDQFLHRT